MSRIFPLALFTLIASLAGCQQSPANHSDARAAGALRLADQQTGKLADTLTAIDRANEVVADNLTNAETTGFKATRTRCDGSGTPSFQLDVEQGRLEKTGRPLDVAIQGNGFFAVKLRDSAGDGIGYTRNGAFFVNDKGEMVLGLGDGYRLQPPITVPAGIPSDSITIGTDGKVSCLKPGSTDSVVLGQLQITQFINPQGLARLNNSIYLKTETSGEPIVTNASESGAGQTMQTYLEASNVDINRENLRAGFLRNWRNAILNAGDAKPTDTQTARAGAE